jgi:hypothetical protein
MPNWIGQAALGGHDDKNVHDYRSHCFDVAQSYSLANHSIASHKLSASLDQEHKATAKSNR